MKTSFNKRPEHPDLKDICARILHQIDRFIKTNFLNQCTINKNFVATCRWTWQYLTFIKLTPGQSEQHWPALFNCLFPPHDWQTKITCVSTAVDRRPLFPFPFPFPPVIIRMTEAPCNFFFIDFQELDKKLKQYWFLVVLVLRWGTFWWRVLRHPWTWFFVRSLETREWLLINVWYILISPLQRCPIPSHNNKTEISRMMR